MMSEPLHRARAGSRSGCGASTSRRCSLQARTWRSAIGGGVGVGVNVGLGSGSEVGSGLGVGRGASETGFGSQVDRSDGSDGCGV